MKDLTVGKEGRLIFFFALPMILGNVFQQLYSIVDSVIVGNILGKEALAAVGASFPVIFLLISLIIGVSMGSTIVIGQYFGAKDLVNAKKAIDSLFIFLFFSSILASVLGVVFSRTIFEMMKLPAEIIPQAVVYFNIYSAGLIFMFGYNGVSAVLRGLGDSKTPLYFLIVATVLNIILVILFVKYFHWGIAGSSVATVIAQAFSFFLSVYYINKYNKGFRFSIRKMVFDKEIFFKSLKIGIPSGLQQAFVALGMIALFRIVNDFGTNVIAAYSAAARIDSFAALPAMNFSAALSSFVAQNIGANKIGRVKKGLKMTLIMTSGISIAVSLVAVFFGSYIMRMFTADQNVIDIGHNYLIIVCAFYIIFSSMFAFQGVLRGAGDTLIPMFITLAALWIFRVPCSYYLSKVMGSDGIWWGIPIGWGFGFAFSGIYYLTGRWKKMSVVKFDK
jgi:putative MATE family efflux protein